MLNWDKKVPLLFECRIALDFGGMFVPSRRGYGSTATKVMKFIPGSRHQLKRALPGSIRWTRGLVDRYGSSCVYLVKRVDSDDERSFFLHWLEKKHIYERTGLLEENILICADRVGENGKAALCLKHKIDIMVDDRYEVFHGFHLLGEQAAQVRLIAFRPNPEERAKYPHLHGRVVDVDTWSEVYKQIEAIIREYVNTHRMETTGPASSKKPGSA